MKFFNPADESQWIDVCDSRKMSERKRREIKRAQIAVTGVPGIMNAVEMTDGKLDDMSRGEQIKIFTAAGVDISKVDDAGSQVKDATILAHVTQWSFGDVTEDVLLDLPGEVYDWVDEKVGQVVTATGGPDLNVEVSPDPKAPISP